MGRRRKHRYQPYLNRRTYHGRTTDAIGRHRTFQHTCQAEQIDLSDENDLKTLYDKEPSEIITTLDYENKQTNKPSMNLALKQCKETNDFYRTWIWLRLINKSLHCDSMRNVVHHIYDTMMNEELIFFVVTALLADGVEVTDIFLQDVTECLISICTQAFELFQDALSHLLGMYELIMILVSSFHSKAEFRCRVNVQTSKMYTAFSRLTEMKCSMLRKWIKPCDGSSHVGPGDEKNFRNISIVPKPYREYVLAGRSNYLRENITKGPYDSVEQYLDIHFRLMREDFMSPLRYGLQQYLDTISVNDKRQRNPYIRVYKNVRIIAPVYRKELMFTIQLDLSKWLKRINWEHSKRLLHGALVCFSSDNFRTMMFGTVIERDVAALKQGKIRVRFEKYIRNMSFLENKTFVMIETAALFEAYRHVLSALQRIKHTLPFENYFVNCKQTVNLPRYLRGQNKVTFDLSPLVEKNDSFVENSFGSYNETEQTVPGSASNFGRNIEIMNPDSWPTCDQLNLDESQFRALQTSLTKELSIIQGPPGTGKSYIGLQIVKILLKNHDVWKWRVEKKPELFKDQVSTDFDLVLPNEASIFQKQPGYPDTNLNKRMQEKLILPSETDTSGKDEGNSLNTDSIFPHLPKQETETRKDVSTTQSCSVLGKEYTEYTRNKDPRPILIVCYTNHALDQFLEGILQFHMVGILRIGKRSRSKVLEKHNISYVRKDIKLSKALRVSLKREHDETYRLRKCLATGALIDNSLIENVIHLSSLCALSESTVMQLEENYYRWTVNEEDYCRRKGYTKVINPSVTVVWLELFRQLDNIAKQTFQRRQSSLHKRKNPHRRFNKKNKLYDLSAETDDFLEEIRTEIPNNAAYEPKSAFYNGDSVEQQFDSFIKAELESDDIMTDEEETYILQSICAIPIKDKWRLYRKWVKDQRSEIEQDSKADLIKLENASARKAELELQKDKFVMANSKIIGMTTTCAAKYHKVLTEVKPRIVIIEEAAEVFESHIISCLSPFCDQLILIGDHKQLRPKPETHDLASSYHLDISLFERMVLNGIHYDCLQLQHRMRPMIADISRHIYPDLKDHESVQMYPSVGGIATNMFCVSHNFEETYDEEQRSYSNDHEAKFAVALTKYIIQQGYETSKITVLTTYKGQLFLLKKLIRDEMVELQNLTVSVVDNYQGEENEIIILSLVRSNAVGRIGFLKISNRICVALSRAKIGFYIIGNMDNLAQNSKLWEEITKDLQNKKVIGTGLPLYCQNHSEEKRYVSSFEDFRNVPDGGCQRPCKSRLDCGHVCERKCHIYDSKHEGVRCRKPCERRCANQHRCTKRCDELCGPCNETIVITLKCGHVTPIPCHKDGGIIKCSAVCNKLLDCGHICKKHCQDSCAPCIINQEASLLRCKHKINFKCGEISLPICQKKCERKLECGHACKASCKDTDTQVFETETIVECDLGHATVCQEKCDTVLECGHKCIGTCSKCYEKRFHQKCLKRCNCDLTCGHICEGTCGECFPCERKCENFCPHGSCEKRCKELCKQCDQPCLWKCPHFTCTKRCGDICNRPRCNRPCMKRLNKCGHRCIGLCGETCPRNCLVCDKKFLKNIRILSDESRSPRVVQLEECNHIVEYRKMDNYMDEKEDVIRFKRCPVCTTPIRYSTRYGTVVRGILLKIERLKHRAYTAALIENNVNVHMPDKNIHNIRLCLDEIKLYFTENTLGNTFLEKVMLGSNFKNDSLHSSNKQFVADVSQEINRFFDKIVLTNLETNCGSSELIESRMKTIMLKRRYDKEIRETVTELISKVRNETCKAKNVMLEIDTFETDLEENKAKENDDDDSKTLQLTSEMSEPVSRRKKPDNTNAGVHIFNLRLFTKQNLPYYNCGKSKMVPQKKPLAACSLPVHCPRETTTRQSLASNDDKRLEENSRLKRQHVYNDNVVANSEAKKRKLAKDGDNKSNQRSKNEIDKNEEIHNAEIRKRKGSVSDACPKKKVKMDTSLTANQSNNNQSEQENNDDDQHAIIEEMLKTCAGSDAVVEIKDTYQKSRTRHETETSKNETETVHQPQACKSNSSCPITSSTTGYKRETLHKSTQESHAITAVDLRNKISGKGRPASTYKSPMKIVSDDSQDQTNYEKPPTTLILPDLSTKETFGNEPGTFDLRQRITNGRKTRKLGINILKSDTKECTKGDEMSAQFSTTNIYNNETNQKAVVHNPNDRKDFKAHSSVGKEYTYVASSFKQRSIELKDIRIVKSVKQYKSAERNVTDDKNVSEKDHSSEEIRQRPLVGYDDLMDI